MINPSSMPFGHTQSIRKKWISFLFVCGFCTLVVGLGALRGTALSLAAFVAVGTFFMWFNYRFSLDVVNVHLSAEGVQIEHAIHGDFYFAAHDFVRVKVGFFHSTIYLAEHSFHFYYVPGFLQAAVFSNAKEAEAEANAFVRARIGRSSGQHEQVGSRNPGLI